MRIDAVRRLFVLAALLFALPAHAVAIDWVTVGDPGNTCDPQGSISCFGSVGYVYRISKYEITNVHYAEFLNAVADTDTHELYNTNMSIPAPWQRGGIARSGSSGSYTYTAIAGREDMPVIYVSFWDALRFANWMHNGQGSGDTETGAYTITADGIANNSITRNADATIFLTSEDEWYKAAYYDAGAMSYYDYPAGTDTETVCALPGATANTANCDGVVDDLTAAGSFTASPSPYGTFDQGGNVWEWDDSDSSGSSRGARGGSFGIGEKWGLAASGNAGAPPSWEFPDIGFRVAAVIPEPSTALLLAAGLAGLAAAGRLRRSWGRPQLAAKEDRRQTRGHEHPSSR